MVSKLELGGGAMSAPSIAVVLGLDQAARTGWGIALVGAGAPRLIAHGVVRSDLQDGAKVFADHQAIGQQALELAGSAESLLVMGEDHGGMSLLRLTTADPDSRRSGRPGRPERSADSVLGQGAAWGYWKAALDALAHPRRLRLQVEPRKWRDRVLSPCRGADSAQLKHLACTWATAYVGEPIEDADQAEGIAITVFAAFEGVGMLEGKRLKRRLYARGKREERRQLELGGVGLLGEAGR